ncbi:hypothetical protein QWY16_09805 [Planococcus shenhongbingii]|uniref:hypothetical protein n=1 Tax=Planococcus shenhongbingii TaxID=3058398 RepID=UPI00261E9FA7|nr:hypothetical protein [Planococcus sp. N016]WKA60376.1 hypothetical protein QWY16_09805 [Planococcus sp. N016]
MNPAETIFFGLIGIGVMAAIVFIWLILRKRKRWALLLTSILVLGFVGYYLYFPVLKINEHEERYGILVDHLSKHYPENEFDIVPERYEQGYSVGSFEVNKIESPLFGVTLYVDQSGEVSQPSTWTKQEYPAQQDLWKELEFSYGEEYSLEKDLPVITKQDEWIDGELTAFALAIDESPAIAVYEYFPQGYGLLGIEQGKKGGFASIEWEGHVFVHIDENFKGETVVIHLKNGKEFSVNAAEHKKRLFVEKIR